MTGPDRLWLTRSRPGADRQARELRAAGLDVIVAPVFTIEPLAAQAPAGPVDLVVFLSENGVLHAPGYAYCADAVVIAIGARTAEVLESRGVPAVVAADADSESVLAMPLLADVAQRRVIVVTGEGGRRLVASVLAARGAAVEELCCYRRVAVAAPDIDVESIDTIVAASGEGAALAARRWRAGGGAADVPVLVPSARVGAVVRELGFTRVVECDGAGTHAILRGMEQLRTDDR